MLIVFVLGFQGVDFFGDIFLSKRLLNNSDIDSETRWLLRMTGILMMCPVVLSTLFMIFSNSLHVCNLPIRPNIY